MKTTEWDSFEVIRFECPYCNRVNEHEGDYSDPEGETVICYNCTGESILAN